MVEHLDRQLAYTEPADRPIVFDGDGGAAYTARSAAFFQGTGNYASGRSQAVMLKAGFQLGGDGVQLLPRQIMDVLGETPQLYRMPSEASRLLVPGVVFVPIAIC